MRVRALIADDEPLARERLRFLLANDPEVEIAGECRNGTEVVSFLLSQPVDVLFLDIQMPGRGGFEALEQMLEQTQQGQPSEKINPPQMPITVFVTAHDQYALRAFDVCALDYLTKPVEPERIRATLTRVKDCIASNNALHNQERLLEVLADIHPARAATAPIGNAQHDSSRSDGAQETSIAGVSNAATTAREYPRRLLIPNGQKEAVVNVHEIEWIEAADYYSCLHVGTRSFMLRETVKQLANTLNPGQFVRIHRSAIVNMDFVREIAREGRGEGAVILTRGQRLRMSKTGWSNLVAASRTN